jgi:hypothetical protein
MPILYNKIDLERQIESLENRTDLEKINAEFLWRELWRYFPSIPVGIITLKKGEEVFRGRPTKKGPSFKKVTDLSYVPFEEKAKCKKYGRCNFPTQSLFYSSNNLDVAQMECLTHHIDFRIGSLSFSKWVVEKDIIIADIILHDMDEVKATSIAEKRNHLHNLIKPDLNEEQFECVKMVLDFFGKQFAKSLIPSHYHYLFSVYLANRLLDLEVDGKKIDGLQYPSIAMNYQGTNIVLKPEIIIDGKLKLVKTWEIMSAISQQKLYSHIVNESIKIENETVTWRANDVIHGEGYFDELESPKTPIEKGGQGILTIEIPFDKEKILNVLKGMGIEASKNENSTFHFILTENCETFVQNYCHVEYSAGTFKNCEMIEKENRIVLHTYAGFLMNHKGELLFSKNAGVYTFTQVPNFTFGFIPITYDNEGNVILSPLGIE